MKGLIVSLSVAALALVVSCCNKAKDPSGSAKLVVTTEDIMNVRGSGQDGLAIEFLCDGRWEAYITPDGTDWLVFTGDNTGSGNGRLLLNAAPNDGENDREAIVHIKSGKYPAAVIVKQGLNTHEMVFKHPSVAFTDEQFAKIKAAYAAGAPSLKGAVDLIYGYAASAYDPASVSTAKKKENTDMSSLYSSMQGPALLTLHKTIGAKLMDDSSKKDAWVKNAIAILYSWALACKDVDYPIYSEANNEPTTGAGMYLARAAWPFFFTYDCWKGTKYISAEQDLVIVAWFRNIEKAIKSSMYSWEHNDYFNKQYYQNHLAAHMWGLLTIGYVLDDGALVQYALDSYENPRDFHDLIEGCIFMAGDAPCPREGATAPATQTGEIYDRYRHKTAPLKGLQYTSLTLQILSSSARTCYNNGIDMYAYTAPGGENLRLCYEFYAPFYETVDSSLQGGYYSGETDRLAKAGDMKGLFELGLNAYPDSEPIRKVIKSISKRAENKVQVHNQLGFTRLYSIDADSIN